MSLRPSLSSFELQTFYGMFGCGDSEIENAVLRRLRKQYADNMPLRVRASEIVRNVVHRGRSAQYPRDEDEIFQITIDALARHGQEHVTCTSIFWEQFFAEARDGQITSTKVPVKRILNELTEGTPLFGARNASSWAHHQLNELRDFIRTDPRLSKAFDVEAAMTWLDVTCEANLDVWCWVS